MHCHAWYSHFWNFIIYIVVVGIKVRALPSQCKCSTIKLYPHSDFPKALQKRWDTLYSRHTAGKHSHSGAWRDTSGNNLWATTISQDCAFTEPHRWLRRWRTFDSLCLLNRAFLPKEPQHVRPRKRTLAHPDNTADIKWFRRVWDIFIWVQF